MISILFLIETIWHNQFRWNYLRNKKVFLECFSPDLKSKLNLENFRKKDDPHSLCISEITEREKRA